MGLTGTDLALTTARVGCLRVGAGRVGFAPEDVEGTGTVEPGEYSWHEVKPEDDGEEWDLMTPWSMCAEPPVASFTDVPDPSAPAESVQFTDTSTPADEITWWHWDFGDGATSDEQNPTHAYAAVGTYTVRLWIASPRGSAQATGTHTVEVTLYSTTATIVIDGTDLSGQIPEITFDVELWHKDDDVVGAVGAAPAAPDWTLIDTQAVAGGDGPIVFSSVPGGVYAYLATLTGDGGFSFDQSEVWTNPSILVNEDPENFGNLSFTTGGA